MPLLQAGEASERLLDEHLARLDKFKRLMPRATRGCGRWGRWQQWSWRARPRYAYRQGLFVLAQSGASVVILNDAKFQLRVW